VEAISIGKAQMRKPGAAHDPRSKGRHSLRSLRAGMKKNNNELVLTPYELTLPDFFSFFIG
jgi:hypothetical protein